jgi:magnesium transporter
VTRTPVDFTRTEKFNSTELDLFLGEDHLVTFRTRAAALGRDADRSLSQERDRRARGPDRASCTR